MLPSSPVDAPADLSSLSPSPASSPGPAESSGARVDEVSGMSRGGRGEKRVRNGELLCVLGQACDGRGVDGVPGLLFPSFREGLDSIFAQEVAEKRERGEQ